MKVAKNFFFNFFENHEARNIQNYVVPETELRNSKNHEF